MNKIKLINYVTPLYRMNYKYDCTSIWIKRDDLIEFAFGGNKVRLAEYIAAYIKKRNVTRVVTYGSQYSNYLRVMATVCALMNIECDLIVLDDDYSLGAGNEILIDQFDVRIVHCPRVDAHDFIDEYKEKLAKEGVDYVWIPGGAIYLRRRLDM